MATNPRMGKVNVKVSKHDKGAPMIPTGKKTIPKRLRKGSAAAQDQENEAESKATEGRQEGARGEQ